MNERKAPSPPNDFDARLRRAREEADAAAGRTPPPPKTTTGLGFAMRLGLELVSALVVGGLIGYLLDEWLGTRPWLMVLFFLLGAGAGFMNVYRVATGMNQTVGFPRKTDTNEKDDASPG